MSNETWININTSSFKLIFNKCYQPHMFHKLFLALSPVVSYDLNTWVTYLTMLTQLSIEACFPSIHRGLITTAFSCIRFCTKGDETSQSAYIQI